MRIGTFVVYFVLVSVVVALAGVVLAYIVGHLPSLQTIVGLIVVGAVAVAVLDGLRNRF